ncbi:MAG: hypothetical protein HQL27_04385 [Candidatus Omnitrophica bacterium]|nr:hypothetical protein [Candidatus Omnitrophota bacterium]
MLNDPLQIEKYIRRNYPRFGVNKLQQISRLAYEIAKREKVSFKGLFPQDKSEEKENFSKIKSRLLLRRYPGLSLEESLSAAHLPDIDINHRYRQKIGKRVEIDFTEVFIEKDVADSELAIHVRKLFPKAEYKTISLYRDHIKGKDFSLADYNQRLKKLFLVKENFDFILDCPCTKDAVGCGYNILNLGMGCGYECVFCFLQSYTNSPGIVLPANIGDFFLKLQESKKPLRIGSGQFTDSLMFDHITNYSKGIVEFFNNHQKHTFEFKTKSDNVGLLLSQKPRGNILVSWSVNPQPIIDDNEFYTAPLGKRLEAAAKCAKAGYGIGFHFDPIIYYLGWERAYCDVIEQIFMKIPQESIKWISLGCLRMTTAQKQAIENRFPENKILDGELILGFDNKLRYTFDLRREIYKKMHGWIRSCNREVSVYLCMEEKKMHESALIPSMDWH